MVPSHEIHFKHSYRFLRFRGINPVSDWIRNIDLVIDEPRIYAKKLLDYAFSDDRVSRCIYEKFNDPLIVRILPSFKHDMRTQRYSRGKTGWSNIMVSVLRRFFSCLYGEDYGLLADLHVLLDMAYKWCCDDDLLIEWAQEIEIHPFVIEYYRMSREMIDLDLNCTYRSRKEKCGLRNVARMLRNERTESNQ